MCRCDRMPRPLVDSPAKLRLGRWSSSGRPRSRRTSVRAASVTASTAGSRSPSASPARPPSSATMAVLPDPQRSRRARHPACHRRPCRRRLRRTEARRWRQERRTGRQSLRAAGLVQLRVDARARSSPARPGTPSSSSCARGEDPLDRAEVLQQRAPPRRPDARRARRRSTRAPRVSRRWRWKPSAKRCASSRTRCRSCRPGESRGEQRSGRARPGRTPPRSRFASAITATRGRS